jgi:D-glycero-alpha-D-manno-heptose-7-phosphate kinase
VSNTGDHRSVPNTKVVARAPCRVDPAGGGTDAPPYCVEYGGAVVNFSIARYSYATFEPLPPEGGVRIYSQDQRQGVTAASAKALRFDGRLDFLKAFVKRLVPDSTGVHLEARSETPERSGLGGSGAMGVAITGAIAHSLGKRHTNEEIALLANDIERQDFGNAGGNQDSFGGAVGGIKLITYQKGGGCSCEVLAVPPQTLAELERHSLLIYTGGVHLSGTIHADIKTSYALENSPTIRAMDELKIAAQRMARALVVGDVDAYVDCLNHSRINHYALHESCDSDTLRKFFRELEPHIRGGKTCGAGGGGFILVHAKTGHQELCAQISRSLGGRAFPLRLDHEGFKILQPPA